ncbi:2197_t:CDS:2, partial [Dentiscutata erythropus]
CCHIDITSDEDHAFSVATNSFTERDLETLSPTSSDIENNINFFTKSLTAKE